MRLGFSTQEAYFTILGVLIVLSAIGTIIGNWLVSRAQGNETRLNNLRVVIFASGASWPLLIVFAIAFCLGEAALLIFFAFASFFALREFIALTPTRRHDHVILIIAFYIAIPVQYILLGYEEIGLFSLFIPVYLFLHCRSLWPWPKIPTASWTVLLRFSGALCWRFSASAMLLRSLP